MAAVADRYHIFNRLNTEVLGISTDSIYSHKIFEQNSPSGRKINFPLLSDRTQKVSKTYGVLNEEEGFAWRGAFIIDPEGRIQAWITNPQPVGRNIDEILRIISALQFNRKTGRGAQASWQPGNPGIHLGWNYVGKY
ncbi:redoxin domain-containing protein [Clostridium sp. D2Q-14]|nr:redoxin domain-containing protein [Anaeromonas gelatinilytica]